MLVLANVQGTHISPEPSRPLNVPHTRIYASCSQLQDICRLRYCIRDPARCMVILMQPVAMPLGLVHSRGAPKPAMRVARLLSLLRLSVHQAPPGALIHPFSGTYKLDSPSTAINVVPTICSTTTRARPTPTPPLFLRPSLIGSLKRGVSIDVAPHARRMHCGGDCIPNTGSGVYTQPGLR